MSETRLRDNIVILFSIRLKAFYSLYLDILVVIRHIESTDRYFQKYIFIRTKQSVYTYMCLHLGLTRYLPDCRSATTNHTHTNKAVNKSDDISKCKAVDKLSDRNPIGSLTKRTKLTSSLFILISAHRVYISTYVYGDGCA